MGAKRVCIFSSVGRDNFEVVIYRQALSLQNAGYDVSFLVTDKGQEEPKNGIKVIPSGFNSGGYLKRIFVLPIKLFFRLKQVNADVYQTACPDLIITCLLLKLKRKKVIYNLREHHPYYFYEKSKLPFCLKWIIVQFMVVWMKFALRHVDGVLTVADSLAEYLNRWHANNVVTVGNYPYVNKGYELTLEDYLKRPNRIIYFGTIRKESRQEIFLKAINRLPNVEYFVAGIFIEKQYEELITSMPEWKSVKKIGRFEREQLDDFLQNSTISNVLRDFNVTRGITKNGSMGIIKLTESMEAALPIICADTPCYREMMQKYKCGILVDPNDEIQVFNAICYLVNNKEEAWRMGQEGRRAVLQEYSWDAQSVKYVNFVNDICIN